MNAEPRLGVPSPFPRSLFLKEQANRVLNAFLEEITRAFHRKEAFTLVGFGAILQRHSGARTGKKTQAGEPVRRV
ncbi:HU family DNA-binding protein [Pseudomonas sp. MUP55]|uniref:HU family DNA-binding protein n=1 Tax=Pseudomonas sp. MUP55 TaxID=3087234 RepID=UPI002A5A55B3|nr:MULTISPECIES: HU family DNA-binding protein [unclassified Pseudomonas]WPN95456.1 HU family DNA-binding protein [Pseudomonas sp. MUP56]WPN98213.1 HU family DNA-binding protein [Pseudomonas sp. MUP55]